MQTDKTFEDDIQMNENIDRELMDMCNLGYGVYERGMEKGEIRTLLNQVQKKYRKGKSCYETANELETDLFVIEIAHYSDHLGMRFRARKNEEIFLF